MVHSVHMHDTYGNALNIHHALTYMSVVSHTSICLLVGGKYAAAFLLC